MNGARGVALVGKLLRELSGGDPIAISDIVERTGLPRSSVYDAVQRLEAAGMISRGSGAQIYPGPSLIRLGYAAFGLGALHGPAEALLQLLSDETGGTAVLLAGDVRLLESGPAPREDAPATYEKPIGESARLTLTLPPRASGARHASCGAIFQRVAATLESYLDRNDAVGTNA